MKSSVYAPARFVVATAIVLMAATLTAQRPLAFPSLRGLTLPIVADAQSTAVPGLLASEGSTSFVKTPAGDWRTIVKTPDGRDVEYVFVPGTKLKPTVRTEIDQEDAANATFTYRWRLINDATSPQQLATVTVMYFPPSTTMRRSPARWNIFTNVGSLMMFGPLDGDADVPSGIPPGSEDIVEFEATHRLPGPMILSVRGNVRADMVAVPGMTQRQLGELRQIARDASSLRVRAIGPAIPVGFEEESGLEPKVLASRVAMAYAPELAVAEHPYEAAFAAAFAALRSVDEVGWQPALARLKALTANPVSNEWQRELSRALGVCVDLLSNGSVPLKR